MPSPQLRVLLVEDSEDDALLLLRELKRGPWEVVHKRVDTAPDMAAALDKEAWDLIIADYAMPHFSGPAALAMANAAASDVPFILVSGAVGEEAAVLAMKAGADDYLSKGNLARLVPAVEREIREAQGRRKARKIAEQLHQREGQLAEALRLARLGTWHWNVVHGTAEWSDEAVQIVARDGKKGQPTVEEFLNHLHPDDRRLLTEIIHDPATKQFAEDFRLMRDADGHYVYICGDIMRNEDGVALEMTGMIQDVTERVRIDQELAQARDAAEAANKAKSEFLANMSHEIRTPMSAILGFAEVVVHKDQGMAERIECAQIIRRNALHLLELINEILDLSKIEASQMTVERVDCELPELLSQLIALIRPRAAEKGLEFGVTFEGPIPRVIRTDPLRLRQILVNLIGNAVKFTNTGKIDLKIKDEGAGSGEIMLRIDVSDTGIGLTQEQLSRLFQPFTQADQSITKKFGGTGLGLTISRRLARLLEGDIAVTSRPGAGSTFTLTIKGGPSADVEMLQDLTEGTLPAVLTGDAHAAIRLSGRILLVEDGRDNQRLLCMQLREAGAEVDTAENGRVAVELATTQSYDLILMDMQMPIMDGYAATIELRRRGMMIPIIALTAYAMADDRGKCMACGCTAYLTKPVNEEALLKTVSQHLHHEPSLAPDQGLGAGAAAESPRLSSSSTSSNGNGDGDGDGDGDGAGGNNRGHDTEANRSGDAGRTSNAAGTIKSSLANNPRIMKILPEFVDGLPGEVHKLADLLDRNDLDGLKMVAHQLVGACGGYGFQQVSRPAGKVEESIETGEPLESISTQVKDLIELIRRIDGYHESNAQVPPAGAANKA